MEDKDSLLILDLDETLIHSVDVRRETPSFDHMKRAFRILNGKVLTVKRPHLDVFLEYAFKNFNVGVWTAAGEQYATEILDNIGIDIDKLEFFYSEKNCTPKYHYSNYGREADIVYFKHLNKLKKKGYDLNRTLMVDDKPVGLKNNYGNLIPIKPYFGQEDDQLLRLIDYLDVIRFRDNFRRIEKRGWSN
ncbi:MAG: putative phosphatase [uncultured marine phage]|uniref:Putative phosphatase n=1 Tax=uncultured marine phage TaxID=707152 RepID=A0A8D9C8V4_9VIRU|nr:MAG: putative phosphatase [uncultured marine phage]